MSDRELREAERAYRQRPTPETHAALGRARRRAGDTWLPTWPLVSGPGWVLWEVRDGGRQEGRDVVADVLWNHVMGSGPRHYVTSETIETLIGVFGPRTMGLAALRWRTFSDEPLYLHAEKQRWIRLAGGLWISVVDPCESTRGQWNALVFKRMDDGQLAYTDARYSADYESEIMAWVAYVAKLDDPLKDTDPDWHPAG